MPPDEPALVVPDDIDIAPLTPALPELPLFKSTCPLDVLVLNPLIIVTDPPIFLSEVTPAAANKLPPAPVLPEPTRIWMFPPAPLVACPEVMASDPEDPPLAVPVKIAVLPLTPWTPALVVPRDSWPDEVVEDSPDKIFTLPPVKPLSLIVFPP
jgi:hypothetical protein